MKRFCLLLLACAICGIVSAVPREYETADDYVTERCRLDICYPSDTSGCPVVVWFHGRGLTSGSKSFPWKLKEKGIVLVAVNYRLLPRVEIQGCIDDAAAAVAWVYGNIHKYAGDRKKIFVAGHSAGGYLTAMIGLDKSRLALYGLDADEIAVKLAGHTETYLYEIDGHGHGAMAEPAYHIMEHHMRRILGEPSDPE